MSTLNRDTILARLRTYKSALEAVGALHLSLFGSVARGNAQAGSDIDLAIVYNPKIVKSLADMGGVASVIEDALGTDDFDLADEEHLKPYVRAAFDIEHVRIF